MAPAETRPPSHPAEVTLNDGQLQVTADNSSLNQILREISRLTGMKITGGVTDERVFGKYGPAAPADILGDLLAGTGSNMMLRETAANFPEELILTPQTGGPTPPNPNASGFEGDTVNDPSPPFSRPNLRAPYTPPEQIRPNPPVVDSSQTSTRIAPPSPPSTGGDTTSSSPAGPQTPQQIYEQLQRLQQAQPKPQTR
jgi:hypothetical protein